MKKFRFSLRPVAVMRAHRELRAREALAAAIHAYVEAEAKLADARGRVNEIEGIIAHGRSVRFRAGDQASFHQAYRRECAAEAEAGARVAAAREFMNQRREEYIEANRQVKTVGKLEQRARAQHHAAVLHAEQAEMDEIASGRAGREEFAL